MGSSLQLPHSMEEAPQDIMMEIMPKKIHRHETKAKLKTGIGEPVSLQFEPYKILLTELLLPHKFSPVEYVRLWPSLPAIVEYTGAYI
ncbi:hypothetical protein NMG60_11026695 [Bertholletia excelsa]